MNRDHLFSNRLNMVRYNSFSHTFELGHEQDQSLLALLWNPKLQQAFEDEDWEAFVAAEAEWYGGTMESVS